MFLPEERPRWTRSWLIAAGIYNIVWGAVVVLFPSLLFDYANMPRLNYPQIWQCVGMIVGVYGVGYLIASSNSRIHWPIVFVGLLGKIFGPIGFAIAMISGDLPVIFGVTILTNDLVWWIPFSMILWDAARSRSMQRRGEKKDFNVTLDTAVDQNGLTLRKMSETNPILVVFLRHTGCNLCKETLSDLANQLDAIRSHGYGIAIVGMSSQNRLLDLAMKYKLTNVSIFSDPARDIYTAFDLGVGSFAQVLGLRVWCRGISAVFRGHSIGPLDGDGLQMPGEFILHQGKVIRALRHKSVAIRINHANFVCEYSP